MIYTSKAEIIEQMKKNLEIRADVRAKALVRIFKNQTAYEQEVNATNCYNGVGFTGADAEFLSSLAKQYIKKGYLSPKQDAILARKIKKYARQLVEGSITEGKIYVVGKKYCTKAEEMKYLKENNW